MTRTAAQIVKSWIIDKRLQPEEQLPAERVLAEMLGLTRGRLRTALRKLEDEGQIRRHVGQGTFIATVATGQNHSTSAEIESSPAEILDVRAAFEPQVAFLAAHRAKAADISNMQDIVERSRVAATWAMWSECDRAFHQALADCTGNRLLAAMVTLIQSSHTASNWGELSESPSMLARRDEATDEHGQIVAAIAARNPHNAAQLMLGHLENVRRSVLGTPGVNWSTL